MDEEVRAKGLDENALPGDFDEKALAGDMDERALAEGPQHARRLAVVRDSGFLDRDPEEALDRLTRLASALTGAPVSLMSFVHEERPFKTQKRRGEAWAAAAETTTSRSFCQHVVRSGSPLVISDARKDSVLRVASQPDGVGPVAYLGVPVTTSDGRVLGSFCTIDNQPREWTSKDVETLRELAAAAATEIDLRQRIARNSDIDALTGLLTKVALAHEVNALLQARTTDTVTMYVIELTRLTAVNESLGREQGDKLVAAVAARLQHGTNASLAGRLTGSRLALIFPGLKDEREVLGVAQRIRNVMRERFVLAGMSLYAENAIGMAVADPDDTAEHLFEGALAAVEHAKSSLAKVRKVPHLPSRERARELLRLETELRDALDREQLQVHYQPRLRLSDGSLVGFEALARWQHGELGWVSPADFIQVAENTGLVIPLGEAVLRTAVQEAVQWRHSSSGQQPYVSVNLSPRQVEATEVADWVQRAVTDAGLPVERLRLEITEATLLDRDHPERLRDLADLGIKLDLDDFGTGYSSLSYISELPLGGLKIDRSFVAGLGDARRAALVEAIISMAAALDLEVTAEGVETGEQRTQLIEMGCDFAQGFLLGRPASSGQTRARVRGISTAAGG